jgi:hypothetical protein
VSAGGEGLLGSIIRVIEGRSGHYEGAVGQDLVNEGTAMRAGVAEYTGAGLVLGEALGRESHLGGGNDGELHGSGACMNLTRLAMAEHAEGRGASDAEGVLPAEALEGSGGNIAVALEVAVRGGCGVGLDRLLGHDLGVDSLDLGVGVQSGRLQGEQDLDEGRNHGVGGQGLRAEEAAGLDEALEDIKDLHAKGSMIVSVSVLARCEV